MRYLILLFLCQAGLTFGQINDSIHFYNIELENHNDQVDFMDRINLLYFLSDSIGDKKDYQVKITGYCSKDNKLKKASSFAQERADLVKSTMLDNGFFEYQIINCEGEAGPSISEDKVWITFFPRSMKEKEIAAYETELQRMASYVFVNDTLAMGDLLPGKIYIMQKISFQKGKRSFDRTALPYLENLGNVLAADTTLKVDVQVHVCCPETNSPDALDIITKKKELTQNRAREVCGFLVKRAGVAAPRLKPVPKGSSEPLVEEKDDASKLKNERLELVVRKM